MRRLFSLFHPAMLKDCALLKESYSCPNNRSNMMCEHKNVDAEESTYVDGSEVVPLFLLRQHTTNRSSNHPLCPWGSKIIELRMLGGRSWRKMSTLGGVGWVDRYMDKEGPPIGCRNTGELMTATVSHHQGIIRHWSRWTSKLPVIKAEHCFCDHWEVLRPVWESIALRRDMRKPRDPDGILERWAAREGLLRGKKWWSFK